jgi:hypothetical protein
MNPHDKIEMLSQPLMTEEGSLNPACLNELDATIAGMGKTHDRLRGDLEWDSAKDRWTFPHDIVGAFAMWACRQSPYGVPDGLEKVCKYLHAALKTATKWDTSGMAECSLCDINKWLDEILYEQGVKEFDAWNKRKNGRDGTGFCSATHSPSPDDDFIDLDALLHNVCLTIRDERRKNRAFDEAFDREHKKKSAE